MHLWYDISGVGGMQLQLSWSAAAPTRAMVQKDLDFLRCSETEFVWK